MIHHKRATDEITDRLLPIVSYPAFIFSLILFYEILIINHNLERLYKIYENSGEEKMSKNNKNTDADMTVDSETDDSFMNMDMYANAPYPIDSDTLELLELKGEVLETRSLDTGLGNGLKIRRIMQIVEDLTEKDIKKLRVLDLACGRGLYAIETALHGPNVHALDARLEWMGKGMEAAKRLGLKNLKFEQNDIRKVTVKSHGEYDIIYFMGVLYRLDVPDSFFVLENLYEMCGQYLIIDTNVSLTPQSKAEYKGRMYEGIKSREHGDNDSLEMRKTRLEKSIDNVFAFIFTKESLIRLLLDTGFTSVFECHAPLDPFKAKNRVTLIAGKGIPVKLSTYPYLNELSEDRIKKFLTLKYGKTPVKIPRNRKQRIGIVVNKFLRVFGLEIRPIYVDRSVKPLD